MLRFVLSLMLVAGVGTVSARTRTLPSIMDQLAGRTTGVVELIPGTYVIDQRLEIRDAQDLIIHGNGAILLTPDGAVTSAPFIALVDCRRVTIRDLVLIDTDPAAHLGVYEETHGITVTDSSDVHIENVTIQGVGDEAINFIRSRRCSVRHSTISGAVAISEARAGAITVTNSHQILIESNWIFDIRQYDAIRIETQNNGLATMVTIRGNQISHSPIGVRINDFGGTTDGVVVADNIFHVVGQAILQHAGAANVSIHDNVISTGAAATRP